MAITHGKVNISSASSSYDYTAYPCTAGSWSSWHLLSFATKGWVWELKLPSRKVLLAGVAHLFLLPGHRVCRDLFYTRGLRHGMSWGAPWGRPWTQLAESHALAGGVSPSECGDGYLCFQMKERFGTVSREVEHYPKQGAWGYVAREWTLSYASPGQVWPVTAGHVANHHQLKLQTKSQWCWRAEGTCQRLGTHKCVPGAVFLPHHPAKGAGAR